MNGLMTAEELAEALAVSPDTVREWARKQRIPAVHISAKVVRFDWQTVLRELAKRQTGLSNDLQPGVHPALRVQAWPSSQSGETKGVSHDQ